MNEIEQNPFRILGLFANATLKERVAMQAQSKAYARVGQSVDNPLQLKHLLEVFDSNEDSLRKAESLLTLEEERAYYASFWFVHGANPNEDLEAVRLLDEGMTSQALSVWSGRKDSEALQNLMVAALVLENWKEAMRFAQQLYHHERDIRRFSFAVSDGFGLEMKQLADKVANNPLWYAVLTDMRVETCRNYIENCLEYVRQKADCDSMESLYDATKELSELRGILGIDNVMYQTLAEQMAVALSQERVLYATNGDVLKWLRKAYDIAIEVYTKNRIDKLIQYTEIKIIEANELKGYGVYEKKESGSKYEESNTVNGTGFVRVVAFFAAFMIICFRMCARTEKKFSSPMSVPQYQYFAPPKSFSDPSYTIKDFKLPEKSSFSLRRSWNIEDKGNENGNEETEEPSENRPSKGTP